MWNLGGPPKLSHFVWRACKGSLGVMSVLFNRHIRTSRNCLLCGGNDETILHAIFDCTHVAQIWTHSEFAGILTDAPQSSFADRLLWLAGKVERKQLHIFSLLAWATWFCRNKETFE